MDVESRLTVGCAGAMLTYLGRRKAVECFPGDEAINSAFQVSSIEMFGVQGMMYEYSSPP